MFSCEVQIPVIMVQGSVWQTVLKQMFRWTEEYSSCGNS
jgi:hypothetical protein